MSAWTNDNPTELTVGTPGAARIQIGPGDSIQVFDAANELIAVIDPTNGIKAVGTDGSFAALVSGGGSARVSLEGPPIAGHTVTDAEMQVFNAANFPFMVIFSPTRDAASASSITMTGDEGATGARITLSSNNAVTIATVGQNLPTFNIEGALDGRVLTGLTAQHSNAILNLTAVPQFVPGISIPYTAAKTGAFWVAVMTNDSLITTAGTTTVGQLLLDGVAQSAQALHSGPLNARATVSQVYAGNLGTVGGHTWTMTGNNATAVVANSFQATHTSLVVGVFE